MRHQRTDYCYDHWCRVPIVLGLEFFCGFVKGGGKCSCHLCLSFSLLLWLSRCRSGLLSLLGGCHHRLHFLIPHTRPADPPPHRGPPFFVTLQHARQSFHADVLYDETQKDSFAWWMKVVHCCFLSTKSSILGGLSLFHIAAGGGKGRGGFNGIVLSIYLFALLGVKCHLSQSVRGWGH